MRCVRALSTPAESPEQERSKEQPFPFLSLSTPPLPTRQIEKRASTPSLSFLPPFLSLKDTRIFTPKTKSTNCSLLQGRSKKSALPRATRRLSSSRPKSRQRRRCRRRSSHRTPPGSPPPRAHPSRGPRWRRERARCSEPQPGSRWRCCWKGTRGFAR